MSLSNILQPNIYNIYSNSQTLRPVATQPVPGNNTLWINSSNNHLYRDGVDLEAQIGAYYYSFISAADWSYIDNPGDVTINVADFDAVLQYAPGGPDQASFLFNPMQGCVIPGLQLEYFDVVYSIPNNENINFVIEMATVQYTNNAENVATPVPITGAFETTSGPNSYVSRFTPINPVTLSSNQKLSVVILVSGTNNTQVNFYGTYCYFSPPN